MHGSPLPAYTDLQSAYPRIRGTRAHRIVSPTQLSASLQKLYDTILDPASSTAADFRDFYSFLFPYLKSEGAKTLPAEVAIPLWSISIAQRYELGQSFVDFAEVRARHFYPLFRTSSDTRVADELCRASISYKDWTSRRSRSTSGPSCSSFASLSSRT